LNHDPDTWIEWAGLVAYTLMSATTGDVADGVGLEAPVDDPAEGLDRSGF